MSNSLKVILMLLMLGTLFYLYNASEVREHLTDTEISDDAEVSNKLPMRQAMPMTFAHKDHTAQQCVSCHHNYQDNTGQGLCIECHLTDKRVANMFREQFHDLCMGCHVEEKQLDSDHAGPLRQCTDCHVADTFP